MMESSLVHNKASRISVAKGIKFQKMRRRMKKIIFLQRILKQLNA
jgi:hypothetical protein